MKKNEEEEEKQMHMWINKFYYPFEVINMENNVM